MALPQPVSTAATLPCKNKYVSSVIIQKIKEILAFMTTITFPIPILSGGTGTTTTPLVRVAFKLPTTNLGAATVIDWAATNNFFNAIAANKTYSMTGLADGLSIQVLIQNTSGGAVTATFPAAVKWIGGIDPTSIPAAGYAIYSFTSINGNYIGVIGAAVA